MNKFGDDLPNGWVVLSAGQRMKGKSWHIHVVDAEHFLSMRMPTRQVVVEGREPLEEAYAEAEAIKIMRKVNNG